MQLRWSMRTTSLLNRTFVVIGSCARAKPKGKRQKTESKRTGIVTAEDVVEEVVGEIEDEYDRGMEYYKKIAPNEFLVPGTMEIRRFEEELGAALPPGDYSTVGGMLISLAGRIPASGESFAIPGAVFTVTRSTERAVKEARVILSSLREGVEEPAGPPETERREGTD